MAVNSHLKWLDFKDFTKGIWTKGSSFTMPPDHFQVMEDCYPQPEGGLRAFFKPSTSTVTLSGIGDATNERVIAFSSIITSTGTAYLMVTKHVTTGLLKGYFWGVGDSAWTLQKTFTAHGDGYANGGFAEIIQYHDNTNGRNVWIVGVTHAKSDGTEDGWWLVRWDTASWTRINSTTYTGVGIVQYQSRIVGAALNTLWWTDPGTITTPSADNYSTIQSGHNDVRDIITNLVPYSPSQLLVSTMGSGWWVLDGDIEDPIVRQMGADHNADFNQKIVVTENGAIFYEKERGTFMTQNMGANFAPVDDNLVPWTADSQQGFGFLNGFLFAPSGRVWDMATSAWFTLSDAATSYSAFEQPLHVVNGVALSKGVFIPQFKASASMLHYALDDRNSSRAESYRVKTAPLQAGDGRQAAIREVEVMVKSYHADSTVAVTVNGTTRTSNPIPVGTNVIRLTFNEVAEYLDVQVAPASNEAGYEAPTIEQFRVGTNVGHTVRLL